MRLLVLICAMQSFSYEAFISKSLALVMPCCSIEDVCASYQGIKLYGVANVRTTPSE